MAIMYYSELHELRMLKSRAFLLGSVYEYRDCLEELFAAVSFKLKKNEIEEVTELFVKANMAVNQERHDAKALLRQIDMKLIEKMHRYGMIFPGKRTDGLALVEKRYGLSGGKK